MKDTTLTILRENAQQIIRKLEAATPPNVLLQHLSIAGDAFALLRVFLVMIEESPAPLAIDRVMYERARQISVERFDSARDDSLDGGVLASAGASYALAACDKLHQYSKGDGRYEESPLSWPFDTAWWKSTTPRRDLEKAGALILAELEKLLRAKTDPVPMILHCPKCGVQHIDASNEEEIRITAAERGFVIGSRDWEEFIEKHEWTNPPHRTHLCAACGHEWRPFEYATTGVAEVPEPVLVESGYTEEQVAALNADHAAQQIIDAVSEALQKEGGSVEPMEWAYIEAAIRAEVAKMYPGVMRATEIINEVHSWAVCAAIASPEDMMQNMPRIVQITAPDFKGEPKSSCDPGDICEGCQCSYNTQAEPE